MKSIFLILVLLISFKSYSQCSNSPYGQFPSTEYIPLCDDSWEIITTFAWSGEYTLLNVVENQHYQFLTFRYANGASRYLTITDEFDTPIVWGPSSNAYADTIGWTATFTGNIKFFTHTNSGCGTNSQQCVRAVRGISPPIVLPVNMITFEGKCINNINTLNWMTESESNSDLFEIEWSYNGKDWYLIGDIPAAGNSNQNIYYSFRHEDYRENSLNYYRLVQIDFNGDYKIYDPISIKNLKDDLKIIKYINIEGREINISTHKGIAIAIYEDGTTLKIYSN